MRHVMCIFNFSATLLDVCTSDVKTIFSKTGNHFVKTGFSLVTGLRDVTSRLICGLRHNVMFL